MDFCIPLAMRRVLTAWILATTVVSLSGCVKKPFDAKRLKQEIPTYISYAAEGVFYVDYLSHDESTTTFATQHAEYLRKNVLKSLKQLERSAPNAAIKDDYRDVHAELTALARDLEEIASGPRDAVHLTR